MHKESTECEHGAGGFKKRIAALVADFVALFIACVFLCVMTFAVVHLFRLWHTGEMIVTAVASCSEFLSSTIWPLLVILLVVLYRRHVLEALK